MDLQLVDKVAIVTGGSRGIGKAIGRTLASEGANVALVGRDRAALEATAAEIAGQTKRVVKGFVADTGDDQSVKNAVAEILAAFNRVDILVNCAAKAAGQAKPPALAEITAEALWAEVNVKVMGYLRMAQAVVEPMAKQGGGRIVNISGLAARSTGSTIGSIRNISVAALTKTLADELAPKHISVVCVHPGLTRTEKTPQVVAWRAGRAFDHGGRSRRRRRFSRFAQSRRHQRRYDRGGRRRRRPHPLLKRGVNSSFALARVW